jgi:hypothetical protein
MPKPTRRDILRAVSLALTFRLGPAAAFEAATLRLPPDGAVADQIGSLVASDETVRNARGWLRTSADGRRWFDAAAADAGMTLAAGPLSWVADAKRGVFYRVAHEYMRRAELLTSLAVLTGDATLLDAIIKETLEVTDRPNWNPAHFLDVAETAMGVCLVLFSAGPQLSAADRGRMIAALRDKALAPGLLGHQTGAFWALAENNWGMICNGALLTAAVTVSKLSPGDEDALVRDTYSAALDGLRAAFEGYAPDGGWIEGPQYWNMTTRLATFVLAALDRLTGQDLGLSTSPGFSQTSRFCLHLRGPSGRFFNFSDGPDHIEPPSGLSWLARRFGDPVAAWLPLQWTDVFGAELLWGGAPSRSPGEAKEPLTATFRGPEIASLRAAWDDPNALWIAIKGGDNKAPHNHLDLGTFVLDCDGTRFALDLGADDYALPGYFDRRRRFGYLRTNTDGHSVLTAEKGTQSLDGTARLEAETTTCRLSATSAEGGACATIDLSRATVGLHSHHRRARLVSNDAIALADRWSCEAAPLPIAWKMLVPGTIVLDRDGRRAWLKRNPQTLFVHLLTPDDAALVVQPLPTLPGQAQNKGVLSLGVHLPASAAGRLVVVFSRLADLPPPLVAAALAD